MPTVHVPEENTQTELYLSWQAPVDNGAPVLSYRIRCLDNRCVGRCEMDVAAADGHGAC